MVFAPRSTGDLVSKLLEELFEILDNSFLTKSPGTTSVTH